MKSLAQYLSRFEEKNFYGAVTLTYVGGRVTLVETRQTLRPEAIEVILSKEETPRSNYVTEQRPEQR